MTDHGYKPEKATTIQLTELHSANTSEVALAGARSTQAQALHHWPQEPGHVQNEPKIEAALTILDVAMIVLPVVLIVKTSLVIYAYESDKYNAGAFIAEASDLSQYLIRFNSWLVTLFTILFVSIVSTLVRRYALWKAERGATIAELEQYQASVSLPSTLKAIWSLRAFSVTSIGLLFLWGWYYAGSQAIQREYALVDSMPFHNMNLTYLSSNATSALDSGNFNNYSQVARTDIVALFHLYSAHTPENSDSGLFKSPDFDVAGYALPLLYDNAQVKPEPGHWLQIPDKKRIGWPKASSIGNRIFHPVKWFIGNSTTPVGSLDGMNFWNEDPMIGKYKYNYSYIDVQCSQAVVSADPAPNGSWPYFTTILNMTGSGVSQSASSARTMDLWVRFNSSTTIQSVCTVTELYVEYAVQCLADGCKTTDMRLQPDFINTLLYACGKPVAYDDSSVLEQDMAAGLPEPGWVTPGSDSYQNLTLQDYLNPDDYGNKGYGYEAGQVLTRYFNTWLTASQRLLYDPKFTRDLAANDSISIGVNDHNFTTTSIHGNLYERRYAIFWPWIVIDYSSCFVLLAAAVGSYWLRRKTLAPDIFGYVSSLTRDNPNFELPGGSTLPGMERSKKLKYVTVKIGDLNGHDGVGRVGMTPLDAVHDLHLRELERDRQYV